MTKLERGLVIAAAALLCLTYLFPIWRIEIFAPQYPEGLFMEIGISSIQGNVDQINILNHYIGMKRISASSIPELSLMPIVIGSLVGLGILAAALKRRWFTSLWAALLVIAATVGLIDFYLWGYDYGHNLNPEAPIRIPGLSYQPPFIGHKTLLNIQSYSLPDWGGAAFGSALGLAILAGIWPWVPREKLKAKILAIASLIGLGILSGCTPRAEPIQVGVDNCGTCHMQISDARFGGEVITKKGRIHKFDSVGCLLAFQASEKENIQTVLVSDYLKPGTLVVAASARYLRSRAIQAPMGDGIAASGDVDGLTAMQVRVTGEIEDWAKVSAPAPAQAHR